VVEMLWSKQIAQALEHLRLICWSISIEWFDLFWFGLETFWTFWNNGGG